MLGNLEAWDGESPVALGGAKQRATLSMLLLCANQVVATSRLIGALWPDDEAPASARNILQNAVWGLRGALAHDDRARGEAVLITRPPGYMLVVDPEDVDLHLFLRLADEGRAQLAQGRTDAALTTLREALGIWRGPLLADMVETGISWPELTRVENARLDAQEDYFEAAMLCGRQYEVLRELENMVESEPLRERACAQLMLALYRSGRHAEALDVYTRMRNALVARRGLDPGREVQLLQQAILNHDPSLSQTPPPAAPVVLTPEPATPREGKQPVSFLLVRCRAVAGPPLEHIDEILDQACTLVRKTVPSYEGVSVLTFGSMCTAVFEAADGDHAARAIRAAVEIREQLGVPDGPGLQTQIVVATGEALLRRGRDGDGLLTVRGRPVDHCQDLLGAAPDGEIVVCPDTRRAAGPAFVYAHQPGDPASFVVKGVAGELRQGHFLPLIDRECELGMLTGILERAGHRRRPHLVTVLGEPGSGKSRLLTEFGRRIANRPHTAAHLVSWQPSAGIDGHRTPWDTEAASRLSAVLEEPGSPAQMLAHWSTLLASLPGEHPLVILIDDLHRLPDAALDFVEKLCGVSGSMPLVLVGAGRPELLERRPAWSGGNPHASTITVDPLSDAALDQLLQFVRYRSWSEVAMLLPSAEEADEAEISSRRSDLRRLLKLTA
ncbi:hypothetical protein JCM9957A_19780 [Kineosporia succinea]